MSVLFAILEEKSSHDAILTILTTMSPGDGTHRKIDMEKKWSSAIFTELLELHTKLGGKVKLKHNEPHQTKGKAVPNRSVEEQRRTFPHRKRAV